MSRERENADQFKSVAPFPCRRGFQQKWRCLVFLSFCKPQYSVHPLLFYLIRFCLTYILFFSASSLLFQGSERATRERMGSPLVASLILVAVMGVRSIWTLLTRSPSVDQSSASSSFHRQRCRLQNAFQLLKCFIPSCKYTLLTFPEQAFQRQQLE